MEIEGESVTYLIAMTKYPTGAMQGNKSLFWCMSQGALASSGDGEYRLGRGQTAQPRRRTDSTG